MNPPPTGIFVDTNVLLYVYDEADPAKQARSREWIRHCWESRLGRVSTQVLNEFYTNARKRFSAAIAPGDARAEVRRLQQWNPWVIDAATIETAWAVESRWGVNYWDALMVSSARHMGCRWLLTEDLQHGQKIDQITVVDPFRTAPDALDRLP